jgi:hypothetical protein
MLKGGVFVLGLTAGLYYGVQLREKGYTKGLTKAFYTLKNHGAAHKQILDPELTFDKLFEMYNHNMLNQESRKKFEEFLKSRNYSKIDEVVLAQIDNIVNDADIQSSFKKLNNRLYDE